MRFSGGFRGRENLDFSIGPDYNEKRFSGCLPESCAEVAELADAQDLKSCEG